MLSEVAENIKGQARGQKEKNGRTGTEEQEQGSKEQKDKSRKQGTEGQEQRNKNSANAQKNKNRKTRTERQDLRQGTEKQDHRTGPKNKRGAHKKKDKQTPSKGHTNSKPTIPPRAPTPVLGSCHKQNNKQNNKTSNRHSCCRLNCTRPFGPRSVVTSTIPPLTGRATRLFYFFFPDPPPPPFGGGRGRRQSNKQNKNNELKYKPSMPPSISKQKEKEIHKETTRQ